jgi:heme oxygenase
MVTIPFSQALRERGTRRPTGDSASERFMSELLTGQRSRDDYVSLVAQNFFVYGALERAAEARRGDPIAAAFMSPALTRLPAIREDLRFLVGADWEQRIEPMQTTLRYVDRIDTVAATTTGGFIAHHYTRYLGDLSGCSIIRSIMQRQFGFETNGVGFYVFADIAKPKQFKLTYREQLDAVDWSEAEQQRVIDEAQVAYDLTEGLFGELDRGARAA